MAEDEIKIPEAATTGKESSGGTPAIFPIPSTQEEKKLPPSELYVPKNSLLWEAPAAVDVQKPIEKSTPLPPIGTVEIPLPQTPVQSALAGRLVPQKPPTALNVGTDAPVEKPVEVTAAPVRIETPAISKPVAPAPVAWSVPQKDLPQKPTTRAEDKLHSGNIVSLLEDRAQKESGAPIAQAMTGMKYEETPIQRSIREIGLKPRTSVEAPKNETPNIAQTKPGELPKIRTYAADMSEEIRKRGETLATIISAERTKMGRGPVGDETQSKTGLETKERTRNAFLSFGAILLVLIGVIAITVTFFLSRPKPILQERVSLIPVNYAELVTLGDAARAIPNLAALREDTDLRLGEMKEFIVTKDGIPMSGADVLTLLGAPSVLSRNANSVMVGIHAFDRNQPFILISVSAYDRAFEGMLAWEETVGESLGAFFAPNKGGRTTASTPPALNFTDRVYQNIDVRESGANWKIMYAFPRRDLLLITTNESTIREVITRLTLQSGN